MIQWKKYNPNDRSISSHKDHLVTNGEQIVVAQRANMGSGNYEWNKIGGYRVNDVTHYAELNLPGEVDHE